MNGTSNIGVFFRRGGGLHAPIHDIVDDTNTHNDKGLVTMLTKKEAIEILNDYISSRDEPDVKEALATLLAAAPPSRIAAARNEATALAEQLHKTGVIGGWQTPPQHSEAMERLLHRLIVLLETMIDLLTAANPLETDHD